MSRAGAFDFNPGDEPTVVANERFKTAIRNFQTNNDLKIDGKIFPGGPTIHALGFKAIGQENGRPSGFDAADFKAATDRDGNRLLNGTPIFAEAGAIGASTTLPAVGQGGSSLGGTLELHGSKNKGEAHNHIRPEILDKFQRRGIDGAAGPGAKPKRPVVTHRQAEQESMKALKKEELQQAELKKRIVTFVPPSAKKIIPSFTKAAAERAIRLGRIPDTTAKRLTQVMRHGSDWERSQAIAYMLRIELANASIVDKLEKTDPALVSEASKRWARFRHYGLAGRSVRKTGLARALHIIDALDRYKKLTTENRNQFSDWLNNLRGEFDVPDSAYRRFRNIKRRFRMQPGRIRVPLTDLELLRSIDRKTGGALTKAAVGLAFTAVGAKVFGKFAGPVGWILSIQGVFEALDVETLKALERRRRGEEFTQRSFRATLKEYGKNENIKEENHFEGSNAIRFE